MWDSPTVDRLVYVSADLLVGSMATRLAARWVDYLDATKVDVLVVGMAAKKAGLWVFRTVERMAAWMAATMVVMLNSTMALKMVVLMDSPTAVLLVEQSALQWAGLKADWKAAGTVEHLVEPQAAKTVDSTADQTVGEKAAQKADQRAAMWAFPLVDGKAVLKVDLTEP